jgi:integrase
MHPELREEIQRTIAWKLNEFEIDRPSGARIRPISAKRLNDLFGQLTGYVQNIERKPEVTSLSSLITREHIARFTSWATNERKVKGQSLSTGLGMVYAALRHNPCYKELDLNWFENIIDQFPIESQSTVDQRKARKYTPYPVAEQIPKRIRAKRMKLKSSNERIEALYAHNELLMLWILLLPWRQRKIRELRVGGGDPNLFKAAIRHYCTATKPNWVAEQERLTPDASFWHIRFAPHETKMKHSVQIFLPAELLPLLQDYLSKHRPVLVRNCDDAGTLFVNHKGKAMNVGQMSNLVKKLASEYAGVPVTPHIYRDIVAFEWLQTHPEDYLTVSKVLWHRNINTTIRIYGHRFDESTGVARMDDWRASRSRQLPEAA